MYKKPELKSFCYENLVEKFGPAQSQYGTLNVGGGVELGALNKQVVEYRVVSYSSEIESQYKNIEIINKSTV